MCQCNIDQSLSINFVLPDLLVEYFVIYSCIVMKT